MISESHVYRLQLCKGWVTDPWPNPHFLASLGSLFCSYWCLGGRQEEVQMPIFQMRKQNPREGPWLPQGYRVMARGARSWEPGVRSVCCGVATPMSPQGWQWRPPGRAWVSRLCARGRQPQASRISQAWPLAGPTQHLPWAGESPVPLMCIQTQDHRGELLRPGGLRYHLSPLGRLQHCPCWPGHVLPCPAIKTTKAVRLI